MNASSENAWTLTPEAFERLLGKLSDDRETAGLEYDALRRKLVVFFAMRGAGSGETLADETIDRVARRLDEGEPIDNVKRYAFGVAKRLWMEELKRRGKELSYVDGYAPPVPVEESPELSEASLECLQRCLETLPENSRALITGYYEGAGVAYLKDRKVLAERLGMTYGALKTRAHRVRNLLETCMRDCLKAKGLVTNEPPPPRGLR